MSNCLKRATKRLGSELAIAHKVAARAVWSLCGPGPRRKQERPRAAMPKNKSPVEKWRDAAVPWRVAVAASSSPAVTLHTLWGTARGADPEAPWGVSKGGFTHDLVDSSHRPRASWGLLLY